MTFRTFKEMEKCPLDRNEQVKAWLQKLSEKFGLPVPSIPPLPTRFIPSLVAGAIFNASHKIGMKRIGCVIRRSGDAISRTRKILYPDLYNKQEHPVLYGNLNLKRNQERVNE